MAGLFLRSLFLSIILSIMLFLSILGLGGYILFYLGSDGLKTILSESEGATIGLASTLAHLAGERLSEAESVALSATMAETVKQTKDRFDKKLSNYKVEEIFLINTDGKPLAHSNVAKLAKESSVNYKKDEYLEILDRENRYPNVIYKIYTKEVIRFFPQEFYESVSAIHKGLGHYLESHYPKKVASRYHLAMAVYPVDQKTPIGALHLIVTSEASNRYLIKLGEYSRVSLGWGLGAIFGISFVFFFLLLLVWHGPFQRLKESQEKLREWEDRNFSEINPEDESPIEEGPTASERELMEDAKKREAALAGEGPTESELELMEDAKARKKEVQEKDFEVQTQPVSYLEEIQSPTVTLSHEPEIYDAIPLEAGELRLGTETRDPWEP